MDNCCLPCLPPAPSPTLKPNPTLTLILIARFECSVLSSRYVFIAASSVSATLTLCDVEAIGGHTEQCVPSEGKVADHKA